MEQTAIFTAPKPKKPFVIKPRHEAIFRSLHDYEYLNAEHLQRLFFGQGSVNYPYVVMKPLVDNGYCYVASYYRKQAGKPESEWHLDRRGNAYLRDLGIDPKRRLRKDKLPESFHHWNHLVTLNHTLISGELLAREQPQITRRLLIHDYDYKRLQITVTLPDGTVREVDPDGLIDYRIHHHGRAYKQTILFEVDRGTNDRRADWVSKIERLTVYIQTVLKEQGMTAVHVAVTAPDEARRRQLMAWTYECLEKFNAPTEAAQYYFTITDPKTVTASDFFLSPQWYFIGTTDPTPIMHIPGQ